jgi:hypothetical protein
MRFGNEGELPLPPGRGGPEPAAPGPASLPCEEKRLDFPDARLMN